jgi:hypothetical protein
MTLTDREALERHLRDAHANLIGDSDDLLLLPSELGLVSMVLLRFVHDANHAPTFRAHDPDDWLARKAVANDA